jgi:hypothetical protein
MNDPNDPNNPYRAPQTRTEGMGWVGHDGQVQRGGCLTAFLVLMMIVNPLTSLVYFAGADFIKKGMPQAPDWAAPVMGVIALVNLGNAIAVWKFRFRRIGVYGFFAVAATSFVLNLIIGVNPAQAIFGAIAGPIILGVLIKPIWHGMK